MSIFEILNTLLLKPLELVFEVVYMLAYKIIENPGLSIIVLSLFMNFMVLPLYMRADTIQEEEHALERKLQKGVEHIKKTFTGDERMMLLQTYYRQNHYKPVYVLRSAVSLFLQILFFIAAYRFLSELSLLHGVSFGPIEDLSRQDGLLQVAGVSVNVLPIIMTAVNLVSCVIFTKGSPVKAKIQLYAMALFFLIFLYTSPAGLVFYWTLNNVFSLVKTCFYKLKKPGKILGLIFTGGGIAIAVLGLLVRRPATMRKAMFIAGIAVLMQVPLVWNILKGKAKEKKVQIKGNSKVFFCGTVFLAILTGALIPSAVIKASPLEFVKLTDYYNPIWYIASSICLAVGIFVIWAGVFYFLVKPSARAYFDRFVWLLAGMAVTNYMFFGKDLGLLSAELTYEKDLQFAGEDQLKNIAVIIAVIVVLYLVYKYKKKFAADILIAGSLAIFCMTAVNITGINTAMNKVKERDLQRYTAIPELTLSKTGKNVIVLMLDRAVGEYIPYLFQEKPELEEQFSGFTYYANTISFGSRTKLGAPVLFGGYEYTPVEMNMRDTELLVDKHNEALKVMPVLFAQNGYQVTVCDPPYAGYEEIPDLSIYEGYPGIESYILKGKFTEDLDNEQMIENRHRNFFCFGILKIAPLCLQKTIYNYGLYNQANTSLTLERKQVARDLYHSNGVDQVFMDSYYVLDAFPDITVTVEENINTFLMMTNDATHEPILLQEPDYVPAMEVDNEEFEKCHQERYTYNGHTLVMTSNIQAASYQVNMATLMQLGRWFDYMREEGVYDNTRIILAADHGRTTIYESDEHRLQGLDDIVRYYPLLMMKDFDSKEFTTSEEFMTNADVPALAVKDTINDPINPFTGKEIGYGDKAVNAQYIIVSEEFSALENNGTQFLPSKWYSVHSDMRDASNWKLLSEEETTFPPTDKEQR